jgi:hypothetical protein
MLVVRADILALGTFIMFWVVYVAEKFGISPVKATARGGIMMLAMSKIVFAVCHRCNSLSDKF